MNQVLLIKDMVGKHETRQMSEYNLQRKCSATLIMFEEEDEVTCPHEDPLVVTLRVGSCDVCRILVDT